VEDYLVDSAELERLFKRYEQSPKGHIFAPLADACRKAGRLQEAVDICQKGLKLHPNYTSGHVVMGKCLYDQGRMDEAFVTFKLVIDMDTENLVALKYLGMILAERGRFEEAEKYFNHILVIDPDNKEIREKLDGLMEEAGEIVEMKPVADEEFEGEEIKLGEPIETSDELATMTLADIFASQGYKAKAIRIYREVLSKDPGNETAIKRIEALKAQSTDKAQGEGEESVGTDPGAGTQADAAEAPRQEEEGSDGVDEDGEEARGDNEESRLHQSEQRARPSKLNGGNGANKMKHTSKSQTPEKEEYLKEEESLDQFKKWLKNKSQ
jgi:tetratricopeptide (TPR) repeat protein